MRRNVNLFSSESGKILSRVAKKAVGIVTSDAGKKAVALYAATQMPTLVGADTCFIEPNSIAIDTLDCGLTGQTGKLIGLLMQSCGVKILDCGDPSIAARLLFRKVLSFGHGFFSGPACTLEIPDVLVPIYPSDCVMQILNQDVISEFGSWEDVLSVAGIAAGGLVLIAIIVAIICCCSCTKQAEAENSETASEERVTLLGDGDNSESNAAADSGSEVDLEAGLGSRTGLNLG